MNGGQEPDTPRYKVTKTIIRSLSPQRQIAAIDGPLWLPTGSVIELDQPNRDAVVVDVRVALHTHDREAWILLSVNAGEEGQFIYADPAYRLVQEDG